MNAESYLKKWNAQIIYQTKKKFEVQNLKQELMRTDLKLTELP